MAAPSWMNWFPPDKEGEGQSPDEVTGAKLYLTYQAAREVSSVTGHWITRASQEEKSAKCIGPRSRKALKIMLRYLDLSLCVGPEGFLWGCV